MNLEKIINETLEQNKKIKVNDRIYLNAYQIEVLKKYQIPYESCNSVNEIIFYIEEILEEDVFEDLENVSLSLSEFDYYHNYKK